MGPYIIIHADTVYGVYTPLTGFVLRRERLLLPTCGGCRVCLVGSLHTLWILAVARTIAAVMTLNARTSGKYKQAALY